MGLTTGITSEDEPREPTPEIDTSPLEVPIPRYILMVKRPTVATVRISHYIETRAFVTLAEATGWTKEQAIMPEQLVGIWVLGEPLSLTFEPVVRRVETVVHEFKVEGEPQ